MAMSARHLRAAAIALLATIPDEMFVAAHEGVCRTAPDADLGWRALVAGVAAIGHADATAAHRDDPEIGVPPGMGIWGHTFAECLQDLATTMSA